MAEIIRKPYFFKRLFGGLEGYKSIDVQGPEAIKRDIDELAAMFNPRAFHDNGTPGGISAENMSESFWQGVTDSEGNTITPSELLGSKEIDGLLVPNPDYPENSDEPFIPAITIWQQIKSVWDNFLAHVASIIRLTAINQDGVHGIRVVEETSTLEYFDSNNNWVRAQSIPAASSLPPFKNDFNIISPNTAYLDGAMGFAIKNLIDDLQFYVTTEDSKIRQLIDNNFDAFNDGMMSVAESFDEVKSVASQFFNFYLAPGNWEENKYTITHESIKGDTHSLMCYVRLIPRTTATNEEKGALALAKLELEESEEQIDGSITITAQGKVPAINIPCSCLVFYLERQV